MKPGHMGLSTNPWSRHCASSAAADDAAISIRWATYSMRLPRSLRSLAMTTNGTLSILPDVRATQPIKDA